MVISDSTGRLYGRPPGGSLVEGSRNYSSVSRRFSRVSQRLSRVFEGRHECQLHRGVRFEGYAKGWRALTKGGGGSKFVPWWLVRRRSLPPSYEGSFEVVTDLEGMGVWVRIHRSDGGCHRVECEGGASLLVSSLS